MPGCDSDKRIQNCPYENF